MELSLRNKNIKWNKIAWSIFSLFLVWHVIGIAVVGPSGKSYLRDNLLAIYGGYLSFFHLDQSWPFYAPNPFRGSLLSYETIDSNGNSATFPLTQARGKYEHAYFRYTNFYAYLFNDPAYTKERGYDLSVARFLCDRHRGESVKSINFILFTQKPFTYQDYQSGKAPLDKEFLTQKSIGPYPCHERKM